MTKVRIPYSLLCRACGHVAPHLLEEDGDLLLGPYRCSAGGCACATTQDGPFSPMTRRRHNAHLRSGGR